MSKPDGNLSETPTFTSDEYKSWALGCSAILASRNPLYNPHQFGMMPKDGISARYIGTMLSNDWGVENREDLINTIHRMTNNGHSAQFAEAYALVSKKDFDPAASDLFGDDGSYMWPLTKTIGDKWGDKQIKAWDWFRMIHLAEWGYVAGYLDLQESYALMTPIIELLRSTFTSWEEACNNYLDGYAWWSRTDVSEPDTEYQQRVDVYENIKDDKTLYNPTVWDPEGDSSQSGAQ